VDESDNAAGQVLLLGGADDSMIFLSTVHLVDLATGACAQQPDLLHRHAYSAAGRLADGRIVCAGGIGGFESAEVLGPPEQGETDVAWTWRELPAMSVGRYGCRGGVMSDSRFAVLGGKRNGATSTSCEVLAFDDGVAHWAPLPPMHDARANLACGAVAGCVIVSEDKKPSEKSTLYRYRKHNIDLKKYYPKNNDLKKLNEVWYEAVDVKNNFTLDKQGLPFKELSTTFIDNKLMVESSGKNITLAKYMQDLLKDYRRVYKTKYNDESSRGHCIFQITLNHHGKKNKIYIGDLAGVEDVSGSGSGENREKFVLKEGLAIRDSVSSFIESFKKKQRKTCFTDNAFKNDVPKCNLNGPIEFLTKELFTDKDAKLMIVACFDPATTNGKVQQNPQNEKTRKIMQLNASVLTSLFKE
jgi:hypothetical protein